MKRFGIAIAGIALVAVLGLAAYFGLSRYALRHQAYEFYDADRKRQISVDIAVRWDKEMAAATGLAPLRVAVVSHGNTVKNTEYSFIANLLAARGFLVASIQHDLPDDGPLMTTAGSLYVGRLKVYVRGEQNIIFALNELKKLYPNADYDHLTLVGHSNGGDISMFFAQQHPGKVRRIVTLDNLRVPFVTSGAVDIISFRSKDPQFKTDPGVLPTPEQAKEAGIDIVDTQFQHNDMSDRGPAQVKETIQRSLDQFLSKNSDLAPVKDRPAVGDPRAMGP